MSAVAASVQNVELIVRLEDALSPAEAGNKAWNLARMHRLGVRVPTGFVITASAFRRFLSNNNLQQKIADRSPVEARELVESSQMPEDVRDSLWRIRSSLRGPLIVRSSAAGEDGNYASFAGQLDSIADVETSEDLVSAVLKCWSSYWNDRVLAYQQSTGVRLRGMAVIVQLQVNSAASGVLFTREPGKSGRKSLYIEYCAGRGEALVSGRITPGWCHVSKTAPYSVEDSEGLGGSVDDLVLAPRTISALARTAVTLENSFHGYQDIEWTMDEGGEIFFVQSRPITAMGPPQVLWSNSNLNENFPDVITPFLYSIAREGYYHYFRNLAIAFGLSSRRVKAMEPALRHIVGVHHGRLFYNLTSIHAVLREAPFGETLATFFNQFVGTNKIAAREGRPSRSRWRQWTESAKIGASVLIRYCTFTKRIRDFEKTADDFAASSDPGALENRPLLALRDDLRRFMEIRSHRWTNASLADTAAMVSYGLLQLMLQRAYSGAEQSSLHNNLLKGLSTIVSVQPAVRLWEISRRILEDEGLTEYLKRTDSCHIPSGLRGNSDWRWLVDDIEEYLDQWGFRFSGELMLTVPSFQEEPGPLFDMLKTYLRSEGPSPVESIIRLQSERITQTERILEDLRKTKRIPWIPRLLQRRLLQSLLHATHRAIEMRERARMKQALLYSRCRRIARAIGHRLTREGVLQEADAVFMFTHSELDDFLSGYSIFPADMEVIAEYRKKGHERNRSQTAADTFVLREGAYFQEQSFDPTESDSPPSTDAMCGTGACGGSVTARATVLESIADVNLLAQGDILVTRQTDPGWAPVFPLIRGLVIERGGMLSHGAIIAREFGLPCVAGVKDAMLRIPQHCRLAVDGDHGQVRIVRTS